MWKSVEYNIEKNAGDSVGKSLDSLFFLSPFQSICNEFIVLPGAPQTGRITKKSRNFICIPNIFPVMAFYDLVFQTTLF